LKEELEEKEIRAEMKNGSDENDKYTKKREKTKNARERYKTGKSRQICKNGEN
jgi:hypothetical protein